MTQIERINKMESILEESSASMLELSSALNKYSRLLDKVKELTEYYGSADWFADFDASNSGKLPENLKYGVLSEDAVYDLITENRNIAIQMLEIATRILK